MQIILNVFGQSLNTLGIVTAVDDKQGVPADNIKPARPAYIPNAIIDILLADLPAFLNQSVGYGEHHRGVVELMVTQQGELNALTAAAVKVLAEQIPRVQLQRVKVRLNQGDVLLRAHFCINRFHGRRTPVNHRRTALLENAGLCPRDCFQCIAQHLGVIQTDIGNDGHLRCLDHIGGVKRTAQTYFQHHDIALLALEVFKGNRADQLKLCGLLRHLLDEGLHILRNGNQILVTDLFSIYLHSFIKAVDVGGGVQTSSVSGLTQDRGCHGSSGAFAVCAGNVDILHAVLGISQLFQQGLNTTKTVNTSFPVYGMDVFDCFTDVHNERLFS